MQNNIIDESLDRYFQNREQQREHKDRLFPTQASTYVDYKKYKRLQGKCLRASYYHCMGIQEEGEYSLDKRIVLSLGDYTEYMLLDMFNRTEILVEKAVKFDIEKYHVSGKLDAIIKDGDKEAGVEIKSIGSNKYTINEIFGSQWNTPAPKWQNLLQTIVYCYAFRERLSHFYLCYIRRDNGQRKIFKISIEPVNGKMYAAIDGKVDYRFTVNEILERYELLYNFVQESKIPPREYIPIYDKKKLKDYLSVGFLSKRQVENYNTEPFGDFECRYCGYKEQCNKDK